jgi:hypothetical protein
MPCVSTRGVASMESVKRRVAGVRPPQTPLDHRQISAGNSIPVPLGMTPPGLKSNSGVPAEPGLPDKLPFSILEAVDTTLWVNLTCQDAQDALGRSGPMRTRTLGYAGHGGVARSFQPR